MAGETPWTPGKWAVGPETSHRFNVIDEDYRRVAYIAITRDSVHAERGQSNARLIACAPEMAEALQLALEYWAHRQQRYKNRSPVWVEKARQALSKITGEA